MDVKVQGGQVLSGEIYPSGSKNSAVALVSASIMFKEAVIIRNVPEITDIERLLAIIEKLGGRVDWNKDEKKLAINNKHLSLKDLDKSDLGNMRGVSLLWGPMLARFGKVAFEDIPGGCTLGVRSLSPHYDAFREMGVHIKNGGSSVSMDVKKAKAATFWLKEMSPTVTENVVMLASSIKGKTTIIGAASEPSVQDLCLFLKSSGVDISGIGSNVITVNGGVGYRTVDYEMFCDHHEVATFLSLGAATGGKVTVHSSLGDLFTPLVRAFENFNINLVQKNDSITVEKNQKIKIDNRKGRVLTIKAQPWPSLPVDSMPLFIPLAMSAKSGQVMFHNWMYEGGLYWTSELHKLGANVIMCDPHRVIVTAGNKLKGATIEAPFIIRATVSLVMSAMIAQGESLVMNADTLYRGHPHFSDNLKNLGAKIEEITN